MVFSVFMVRDENSNQKHFLSALHTAVFPTACYSSVLVLGSRILILMISTIFLRACFPLLPSLSQVVFLYARTSRPYKNTTAHRSIVQFQVFTALCTCLFHRFSSLFSAVSVENFGLL